MRDKEINARKSKYRHYTTRCKGQMCLHVNGVTHGEISKNFKAFNWQNAKISKIYFLYNIFDVV